MELKEKELNEFISNVQKWERLQSLFVGLLLWSFESGSFGVITEIDPKSIKMAILTQLLLVRRQLLQKYLWYPKILFYEYPTIIV